MRSVERFVLEEMCFCFSLQPHFKIFRPCGCSGLVFFFLYLIYGQLVNSSSSFHIHYGVDPKVGKICYIHEVLARLLVIYKGWVDFEVIWF
jgi:hypothetical protein